MRCNLFKLKKIYLINVYIYIFLINLVFSNNFKIHLKKNLKKIFM